MKKLLAVLALSAIAVPAVAGEYCDDFADLAGYVMQQRLIGEPQLPMLNFVQADKTPSNKARWLREDMVETAYQGEVPEGFTDFKGAVANFSDFYRARCIAEGLER